VSHSPPSKRRLAYTHGGTDVYPKTCAQTVGADTFW
jgi:hypothetical protein